MRLGVERNRERKPVSDRKVSPEIGAEKAYDKIFEESRREDEIVSGVRTKIDKRK